MNIHIGEPTTGKLTSMHFYAWKKGLKTGMYYLRTQPKAQAIQFTVDQAMASETTKTNIEDKARSDEISKNESLKSAQNNVGDVLPSTKGLTLQDDEDICLSCGA